ncbi:tyrosine-sulfated glycopeptide receptor 1 [Prunus yedoensis var. nudiflora]|uniref:Tyrosine-sulfated glycopeptide receptor 1 n=1 Tax=Prunus yedoensis var. nudiflora TaxID=2094558 RepID=A0A314ZUT5_PRUYE|nr:tyrosine-sulfated glycopeptide receptor 1 [Prunus yedoensis var. nudiflora]
MNCTNLVELHLGSNNLEGDISMLDFSKLSQLTKLDLRNNNFTGTVPISLYSCRSLKAIGLSRNRLEGQIQAEILSLKSLSFLSIGYNQFTNLTRAMKILMSCKSLHALILSGAFKGEGMPFDDDMVDFDGFQNLRFLSLAGSNLTGQIPVWLSKLKNIEILMLGDNQITGPIPSWLGTLPRLFYIDLSDNQISGEFPKQLCRLPRLIYEAEDQYEPELPVFSNINTGNQLFHKLSSFLAIIDLFNNNMSGHIPTEIGQLQLIYELTLYSNNFSGVIPDQISNLKKLEVLDLSNNHLSGIIPSSLASLNFLRYFNMPHTITSKDQYQQAPSSKASMLLPLWGIQNFVVSHFQISVDQIRALMQIKRTTKTCTMGFINFHDLLTSFGAIPSSFFQQASNLTSFNVNNNTFTGNHLFGIIPSSLASLNFLKIFDASYNNLEGPIPTGSQFQSFDAFAFEGNPKLCGAPLPNKCRPNKGMDADNENNKDEGNGHHQLPWFYIFTALGFIVGFWGVCGSLFINKTWRYAYFRFIDNRQDRLYVMIIVSLNRMKRRLRG